MWLGATDVGVFKFQAGQVHSAGRHRDQRTASGPAFVCWWTSGAGLDWRRRRLCFVPRRRSVASLSIPRHLPDPMLCALGEEPDGTVWAGSVSEGLLEFKEGKLVTINASSGLSDNSVESLLVDRDGNLWVGTDVGLNLLRQKNLFAFDQRQGLGYGAVDGLAEIAPGCGLGGQAE